ncbi:uncharacterized protein TRIVIDRAFT_200150 [Trichoderma virens Gv29-8]|uniref:Uncharacterized protein n=1 Tax=Hypocrea virens (strain Gv29-8 / FGSC 10586) TaxID=413071 RepID=G9MPL6_HYPVG|nr:uncharacterized protein TRIVIDRAFT_200150 [Trichoderma virens Gv29-8]EHK23817.1 hypothetical protein TRIVIDRAFT_200150 [Trichoderma virens Gv29-8]UKZ50118.1 hypothetical protein TrVGV298_004374 [Trichoderma virens]
MAKLKIKMPKKTEKPIKFGEEDLGLEPDDPLYEDGMKCVRTYWAQATRLTARQQEQMIGYMQRREYAIIPSAKNDATLHKIYIENTEWLSWPAYLILASIYDKLPEKYNSLILQLYGTLTIKDYTKEYLEAIDDRQRPTNELYAPKKGAVTLSVADDDVASVEEELADVFGQASVASIAEELAAIFSPVSRARQSAVPEGAKRPRTFSDNPPIEPKRVRRSVNKDDFDIDKVVSGVMSSHAIRRLAEATRKPQMTNPDLFEMEDVKVAKEISKRNEAKIDEVNTKLDKFVSEMHQFMTAFANTASIPLPIEVIEDDDDVEASI